jgi:hypothetical protein
MMIASDLCDSAIDEQLDSVHVTRVVRREKHNRFRDFSFPFFEIANWVVRLVVLVDCPRLSGCPDRNRNPVDVAPLQLGKELARVPLPRMPFPIRFHDWRRKTAFNDFIHGMSTSA